MFTGFGDTSKGHVTCATPIFHIFLCVSEILPLCICVTNFKSLALLVLEIRYGVRQNLWGSRDLGHAPFLDFSLQFWDIAAVRLSIKFQVSSSTRFGDTLGCTPKIMGVTPGSAMPRPGLRCHAKAKTSMSMLRPRVLRVLRPMYGKDQKFWRWGQSLISLAGAVIFKLKWSY